MQIVVLIMLNSTHDSDIWQKNTLFYRGEGGGEEDNGNRNVKFGTDKMLWASLHKCKLYIPA